MNEDLNNLPQFKEAKPLHEVEKELSKWAQFKENIGETRPWDVVNPNIPKASDEKSDSRFSICKECPELIQLTGTCKKCGCFMFLKTKLENAECPLGKW